MTAPITVVIPTLNAASRLEGCIVALQEGMETGLIGHILVSDGGSEDGTQGVAARWGAQVVSGPASRGGQLQRGCLTANSEWLLILHADTCLDPGWVPAVRRHLQSGKAGWFRLRFDVGGRFVAAWANVRSRWFGLPYGDQGLLLPRALYDACGGYQDQPLMEDVALVRALRGQLLPIQATAVTSSEKYRREGWMTRGATNLWTLARYFAGASPEVLARAYDRPAGPRNS